MVLVVLPGLFSIQTGADPMIWALLVAGGVSILRPRWMEQIPVVSGKVAGFGVILWVVGDAVISAGDVLPVLIRSILMLTAIRMFQVRGGREDFQLLLLTLFILVLGGVLSMSLFFAVQLVLIGPLAIGLLLGVTLAHASGKSNFDRTVFRGFRWRFLLRRWIQRLDRQMAGFVAAVYVLTLALTALIFVALPRFDMGHSLPFFQLGGGSTLTGFSDRVVFGDVVDIMEDTRVAMRVDVEGNRLPDRPYWRMVVLDRYDGDSFRISGNLLRRWRSFQSSVVENSAYRGDADGGQWTFYLEGGISAYLPVPGGFDEMRFNHRQDLQVQYQTHILRQKEANSSTLFFRFTGMRFTDRLPYGHGDRELAEMEQRAFTEPLESPNYPESLLAYPGRPPDVAILESALAAFDWEKGMPAREFANVLGDWLQSGRGYSLETTIPPGDADRLLRWVESGSAGHCELYAGAFILLARYAGYPARMVTGFAGGDWNGFENYYMVKNRHAHAWVELYDWQRGWFRFDPTPSTGFPGSLEERIDGNFIPIDRTFAAYLDSLRVLWYRRVVNFDAEEQQAIASAVTDTGSLIWEDITASFSALWRDLLNKVRSIHWGSGAVWLNIVLAVAGAWAVRILLRSLWMRLRWMSRGENRWRRDAARWLYRADRSGHPWRKWTEGEAMQEIRFGPPEMWSGNVDQRAQRAWDRLRLAERQRRKKGLTQ